MPTISAPDDVRAANRLTALRKVSGLPRETFLHRCQADPITPVTQGSVGWLAKVERGQTAFPWHYVETFARALDCHPDEIRLPWVTRRQP